MDPQVFQNTLDEILTLNEREGPHTNVFEPKFKAREQAEKLLVAIKNAFKDALPQSADTEPTEDTINLLFRSQWQLARLLVFLGNNAHELEDEKDAQLTLLRSAALALKTSNQELIFQTQADFSTDLIDPIQLPALLKMHSTEMASAETKFFGVQWLLDVLNSLGVFFSARMEARERVGDAICVLHKVEEIYHSFNKWAKESDGDTTTLESLPWKSDEGMELDFDKVELPSEEEKKKDEDGKKLQKLKDQFRRRMHMEQRYTSTLFYLAQGYGLHSDHSRASKYAFLTMVHQLLCRKDFSKKDWATNAVHLSGFFLAEGRMGYARHCLDAARTLMPMEPPSEDNVGMVAWGFLKLYKTMLRQGAAHKEQRDGREEPEFSEYLVTPRADSTNCHVWWRELPLPGIAPAPKNGELPIVRTFDEALSLFKMGKEECELAQKYFTYDTCCPDYINLCLDQGELYRSLAIFEPALDRRILMHMRRVELMEKFPKDLNFDSYTRLVRQTLFDMGEILGDVIDLRHEQRAIYVKECHEALSKGGAKKKPPHGSSDSALTALVKRAQQCFIDFCDTYRDKITKQFPKKIEKDAHPAYVRALIRIARLEGKYPCATPKEEYEQINRIQERYDVVTTWSQEQGVLQHDRGLEQEVKLAGEMRAVLEGKKRDLYRTYAK